MKVERNGPIELRGCGCLMLTENPSLLLFLSLETRVKKTLHKAFWDSLEEQLPASPPDSAPAIQLLQEIKEALLSLLLPRHNQLRTQIEEALDMELMRQEAEHGALDIRGLTTYVLGTMARLRAPIRDEDVRGLQGLAGPAQLLREIFRVLGLMKRDMPNFTIQSLRTHLQHHTVHYEQKKFQDLLDKLPSSLDHTRGWLRRAAAEVSVSQPPPQPAGDGSPAAVGGSSVVPSLRSALNRGYVNLLCWEPGQQEYPETLFMGQARLQEAQAQVRQPTVVATVLLVAIGTCGSTLCGSPGFVARLKPVTKVLLEGLSCTRYEDTLEDISDQVLQEVSRTLSQLGHPAFTDKRASLQGQIQSVTDKGNAVRRIIGHNLGLGCPPWSAQDRPRIGASKAQHCCSRVGAEFSVWPPPTESAQEKDAWHFSTAQKRSERVEKVFPVGLLRVGVRFGGFDGCQVLQPSSPATAIVRSSYPGESENKYLEEEYVNPLCPRGDLERYLSATSCHEVAVLRSALDGVRNLCLTTRVLCKGRLSIYVFVFILLLPTEQRVHSFLSLFISSDGQDSPKDLPKGLDPIQEELLELGRRIGSVIHHKWQVFGPYYSGILRKLLLSDAEPDSAGGTDSF
ncbi:LOW QUALITY PROTEIN: T-complex protein 11 homolog [Rhynochetos jubatus]